MPLSIGLLFVVNYVLSKVLEWAATAHAVVEIKEHDSALLWLCVGLGLLIRPAEMPMEQMKRA